MKYYLEYIADGVPRKEISFKEAQRIVGPMRDWIAGCSRGCCRTCDNLAQFVQRAKRNGHGVIVINPDAPFVWAEG